MPFEQWNPDVDEGGPNDGRRDDTIIRRRKPKEGEGDIPPQPGLPFGIPGSKKRPIPTPPPPMMIDSGWQY
jgi:hypothetical protein